MNWIEKDDLDLSKSKWTVDQIITSEVIYESLCENYTKIVIDTVLEKLEIVPNDLSLGDNQKIILRILNGDI
jgi:hypothetical protein